MSKFRSGLRNKGHKLTTGDFGCPMGDKCNRNRELDKNGANIFACSKDGCQKIVQGYCRAYSKFFVVECI